METITLGSKVLSFAPLNLKTLRFILPRLEAIGTEGLSKEARVGELVEVLHATVSRTDPTVTKEWLEENVLVSDVPSIMDSIMKASGLKRVAPGEAPSP